MRHKLALLLMFVAVANAQTGTQGNYRSKFENDVVAVYALDLAEHASAASMESAHDSFWVSLSSATVVFSGQRDSTAEFAVGDVRFFPSFEIKRLANNGTTDFHGILVVLKPRALISNPCDCTGNTGKTLCGCKGANHFEPLWAYSLGNVTLAGTSLSAGEGFRSAAPRDDMLLLAITDLDLYDEAKGDSELAGALHLKSGEAAWIRGGRHQFKNIGSAAAKLVTFEF